jgi:hypothetical protein
MLGGGAGASEAQPETPSMSRASNNEVRIVVLHGRLHNQRNLCPFAIDCNARDRTTP